MQHFPQREIFILVEMRAWKGLISEYVTMTETPAEKKNNSAGTFMEVLEKYKGLNTVLLVFVLLQVCSGW